jgi:methionyl-tRNA synthetase
MAFGQDASFSDEAFLLRYNADLANDLGNTASRVIALCRQTFNGTPGELCDDNDVLRAFVAAERDWREAMDVMAFHRALEAVWRLLSAINGHVVAKEPWKIRKEEGTSPRLHRILYGAAEGVRLAAVMLFPFLPATSRRLMEALGLPAKDPTREDLSWGRLPLSKPVAESLTLFPRADAGAYLTRRDPMDEKTPPPAPAPAPQVGLETVPLSTALAAAADGKIGIEEFQRVELRTAKILTAERVPKSNKLVKLEVDLGSEKRQIVAGIGAQYAPEVLVGRNVVVVANLKPAKLMGVESNGMVLAATVGDAGVPVLLDVPAEAPPGSKVK